MSDYAVPRPGGSLKFKGDSDKCVPPRCAHRRCHLPLVLADQADGRKKKKKKSHAPEDRTRKEADVAVASEGSKRRERDDRRDGERERDERRSGSASASASPAPPPSGSSGRRMTDAERRFEEVQRKRREERAKKNAHRTHKDRVAELNARLDSMSEHYDMPRVSVLLGRRVVAGRRERGGRGDCGCRIWGEETELTADRTGLSRAACRKVCRYRDLYSTPRRACMFSEDQLAKIGSVRGFLAFTYDKLVAPSWTYSAAQVGASRLRQPMLHVAAGPLSGTRPTYVWSWLWVLCKPQRC